MLPTNENNSFVVIEKVEHPFLVHCEVLDDDDNVVHLNFEVATNTGLTACVAGTESNHAEYTVPLGGSVTLAVDAHVNEGGLYYHWISIGDSPAELPTDDSTSSFQIKNLDKAYEIQCAVEDDEGNTEFVSFDVQPDTGLRAWIEGSESNYQRYDVSLGSSVLLSVKAETSGGSLHYVWSCFDGDCADLPADDRTSSFTLKNVDRSFTIECMVTDDLGARVYLQMDIHVDNGLKAFVAGTERTEIYYFDSSESRTLAVEASANLGELSYQWYQSTNDDFYSPVPDNEGPSLLVDAGTEAINYFCKVTDIYGGSEYVNFRIRPGMAQELPFRTETAFESDPVWNEILICFTPETSGSYLLKTASGDPFAWCYLSDQDIHDGIPATFDLEGGKTSYIVIYSEEVPFTLHLTMDRSGFRTFAELQELLARAVPRERLFYEGSDDPFVIPEDLTIPDGVYVFFDETGVEIAANAKLTVEENAILVCSGLNVKGGMQNNGLVSCKALSGQEKISYGEKGQTVLFFTPETEEELRTIVDRATLNTDPNVKYEISFETDLTITRDLTIASVSYLYVEKTVTVAPGVTLELAESVDGSLDIYEEGQLRVLGTLQNNAVIYLYKPDTLLLKDGGVYSGDGILQALRSGGKAKDYFPWASLPEYSDYEIMADGDWYFLSKKIAAEPGDANGDGSINSKDLLLLRKMLIGLPPEDAIVAPDVNGDGSFDIRDLVRLRKLLSGMEQG